MTYYAPGAPAPVRRRRRWPLVLLIVVVVLAALLVVADRVALALAESRAADALQSSQNLRSKPDVAVPGFPFLTQLAARDFDEVDVTAHDIEVGNDRSVQLEKVAVALHDVTVSGDYSSFHAQTATADATISYAELTRVLGTPISDAGNGRLQAEPSVNVLGQNFTGTVSADVRTSGQTIEFVDARVSIAGIALPPAAVSALGKVFGTAISLAGLPFDVRVRGVSVDPSGVVVKLAGSNLTYRR